MDNYKKAVSAISKRDISEGDEVVMKEYPSSDTGKPEERAVLLTDFSDDQQLEFQKLGKVVKYHYEDGEGKVTELSDEDIEGLLEKSGPITKDRFKNVELFREFVEELFNKEVFPEKKRIETINYRDLVSLQDVRTLILELNARG